MTMTDEIQKQHEAARLEMLREKYHAAIVKFHVSGHVHSEAFALMHYRTKDGRLSMQIWNSRNGVTPFCIRWADLEWQHVEWLNDVCDPGHVPNVGDLIFADFTPERILESKQAYVERHWSTGEYPMNKQWFAQWAAVADLTEDIYESGVPPDLVEVTAELSAVRGWNDQRRAKAARRANAKRRAQRESELRTPPSGRFA